MWPADAIPDLIPMVGFADDLGALSMAIGIVAAHIKREHRERAQSRVREWFADEEDGEPGE